MQAHFMRMMNDISNVNYKSVSDLKMMATSVVRQTNKPLIN